YQMAIPTLSSAMLKIANIEETTDVKLEVIKSKLYKILQDKDVLDI
ncbi:13226_t:CDS:1, partial [Ambispora leptoticha]